MPVIVLWNTLHSNIFGNHWWVKKPNFSWIKTSFATYCFTLINTKLLDLAWRAEGYFQLWIYFIYFQLTTWFLSSSHFTLCSHIHTTDAHIIHQSEVEIKLTLSVYEKWPPRMQSHQDMKYMNKRCWGTYHFGFCIVFSVLPWKGGSVM